VGRGLVGRAAPTTFIFIPADWDGVRIELILVGDELLEDVGGVQPQYIQEMLRDIHADVHRAGASIGRLTVVGDSEGELAGALRDAATRGAEGVVVFGGLGPTHDDRTRDEAAAVIGQGRPAPHAEAMAWLLEKMTTRGLPPPEPGSHQERMGHSPPGAIPIPNITGMAAGLRFRLPPRTEVWCLPGVTIEALPMWREHILPVVVAASGGTADRGEATLMVRGVREGVVAPVVDMLLLRHPHLKAGVYLTELERNRFRGVRIVLRGPSGEFPVAYDDLTEALRELPGATVEGSWKRSRARSGAGSGARSGAGPEPGPGG